NHTDSTGAVIDTLFDAVDLGLDAGFCLAGDSASCAFLVYDVLAVATPGLPGSYGNQAFRQTDNLGDVGMASRRLDDCDNSFTAGTLVHTEDGLVPIEEVKLGDKVYALDPDTGEYGYFEVVYLTNHSVAELLYLTIDGEIMEVTPNHPIYIEGRGWVAAEDVAVGDSLRRKDGGFAQVLAIERVVLAEPEVVYNFTVKGVHTYFVLEVGVLVHNIDCLSWAAYKEKNPNTELFDVRRIGFTQKYYTYFTKEYTLGDNVFTLLDNPGLYLDVPPIQIFRKNDIMDEWGKAINRKKGYFGYANRLKGGMIYSVDNRRLAAYLAAGRETIPVEWLKMGPRRIWRDHGSKFSTADFGFSIQAMPYEREFVLEPLRKIY
ncbi:MAG: hypothetical protein GY796_34855, partial [Chloroflexi bacterium]|nr:hypothetical protein [Chloroflexota bacterium]